MPKNNLKLAKEWILKSRNDLKSAEILFKENGPTDSLCFHCHQAVEKILKGFLVFNRREFPKVHDLIHLLNLCKKIDKSFNELENEVPFLKSCQKSECHQHKPPIGKLTETRNMDLSLIIPQIIT